MLLNDEVELLRRLPLFAGVAPAKLKLLAFTSDRIKFDAGKELFKQGDAGDAAYVVLSGNADVLVKTEAGEIKVATVNPSELVGDIAILCDVPRTATVRAATPLLTLRIKKENFLKLLSDFPEMTVEIMRVLATRLSRTTAELSDARSQLAHARRVH
ncbi:MAG: Crp/Fnr family transcriptional regulator [Rhizobiales bacterium]|nr:Crp/Fnr family transcriptional regulator [Hyphomicrobiales bacterium]